MGTEREGSSKDGRVRGFSVAQSEGDHSSRSVISQREFVKGEAELRRLWEAERERMEDWAQELTEMPSVAQIKNIMDEVKEIQARMEAEFEKMKGIIEKDEEEREERHGERVAQVEREKKDLFESLKSVVSMRDRYKKERDDARGDAARLREENERLRRKERGGRRGTGDWREYGSDEDSERGAESDNS